MNIRYVLMILGTVVMTMALIGTVGAAELKIGFVNLARLSAQAPQAQAARQKLEQEFTRHDKKITAMQKNLSKLKERLQRNGAVMSDAIRQKLEQKIIAHQRDIRRAQAAFREDFNKQRNEVLAKLQRQIIKTVDEFAKAHGYDLIVTGGVIYASNEIDITDQIIARLRVVYQSSQE